MPEYRWRCLACRKGNSEKVESCEYCGANASTTGWELDAREFAIKHMLGGKDQPECSNCGNSSHKVEFSEDPHTYFESRERPLLKAMFVDTTCNSCGAKQRKEYAVPTLRKLYRFIFRKDIENEWWLNK